MNGVNTPLCRSVLFVLTFSIAACIKGGGRCESPETLELSEIVLTFVDSSGDYLYPQVNGNYDKEKFRVTNERGVNLVTGFYQDIDNDTKEIFYKFGFAPLYEAETDSGSFESEQCKYFVIHYNMTETDTVQFCFTSRNTKCGSEFDHAIVKHDQQEIAAGKNLTIIEGRLTK